MKTKSFFTTVFAAIGLVAFTACSSNESNEGAASNEVNEAAATEEVVGEDTKSEMRSVIAMINHADWCPACQNNGPRVKENVVAKFMQNENYQIIVNDLTNDETIAESAKACKEAGILEFAQENKGTGMIYLFDAESKALISQISVAKSNEEITATFEEAAKV